MRISSKVRARGINRDLWVSRFGRRRVVDRRDDGNPLRIRVRLPAVGFPQVGGDFVTHIHQASTRAVEVLLLPGWSAPRAFLPVRCMAQKM